MLIFGGVVHAVSGRGDAAGLGLLPSFYPCVGMALVARITLGRPLISEFVLSGLAIWLSFVAATWLFLIRPIKAGIKPNKIIFIILTAVNYWIGLIIGGALYTLAYALLYGFTAGEHTERSFSQGLSDNPLYKLVSRDEAKILEALLSLDGRARQRDLAKLTGLGKVKTHRIVRRLARNGAVKIVKESRKKSIIQLDEELLKILKRCNRKSGENFRGN